MADPLAKSGKAPPLIGGMRGFESRTGHRVFAFLRREQSSKRTYSVKKKSTEKRTHDCPWNGHVATPSNEQFDLKPLTRRCNLTGSSSVW